MNEGTYGSQQWNGVPASEPDQLLSETDPFLHPESESEPSPNGKGCRLLVRNLGVAANRNREELSVCLTRQVRTRPLIRA